MERIRPGQEQWANQANSHTLTFIVILFILISPQPFSSSPSNLFRVDLPAGDIVVTLLSFFQLCIVQGRVGVPLVVTFGPLRFGQFTLHLRIVDQTKLLCPFRSTFFVIAGWVSGFTLVSKVDQRFPKRSAYLLRIFWI
jgi:hypothetical protein